MVAVAPVLADTVTGLLRRYHDGPDSSARVLLVTIFGDALLPRRQPVSVRRLAGLVEPFGFNERLVRTSLSRLSSEGIVTATRRGRESFYSVHPDTIDTFRQADHRIYHRSEIAWDGQWTIAVLDPRSGDGDQRQRLRQELEWLGLGSVVPGTYLSPTVPIGDVAAVAERLDLRFAVLMRAPLEVTASLDDVALAALVTPLDGLRAAYELHCEAFAPALDDHRARSDPLSAFVLRTLLIDGWRRLTLRDLDLPAALLSPDWPAAAAYDLTGRLYRAVSTASEGHLDHVIGPPASTSTRADRFADCAPGRRRR